MELVSAPTVSDGEESLYSRLTGEEGGGEPHPKAEIARRLREQGPSGFDPRPYLARLSIPGLWVLGANDLSQPTDADLVVLRRLERAGKEYTAVVIPGAGHGPAGRGGRSARHPRTSRLARRARCRLELTTGRHGFASGPTGHGRRTGVHSPGQSAYASSGSSVSFATDAPCFAATSLTG